MDDDVIFLGSQKISLDTQNGKEPDYSLEVQREMKDLPKYLLGKSYFDCKEYDRATSVLKGCESLKCRFLKLYARYLVQPLVLPLTEGW